jgi:primosomal protein N' (replication factor Y)
VRAPLRGAPRVGLVVATREAGDEGLKPLASLVDAVPVASAIQLDLLGWISAQSLSSPGSTAAALLPPALPPRAAAAPGAATDAGGGTSKPELHLGAGRERRVLELASHGAMVVLVADIEAAARWAQRLGKIDRVVRLDSGVPDTERTLGWADLAASRVRLAVATRSGWLAPLWPDATLALVDEQDAAHKPPGHPRIHARDVALERARRERLRLVMTAGTPSVEMWWRGTSGYATIVPGDGGAWPHVTVADTRGILRREALTPELARALRETLAAGHRAFLAVSRLASTLACDECGLVSRCEGCGVALAYSRAAATLTCRVCGRVAPVPETCPQCRGRRLSPFGWGLERVEHAVRRRFPKARVARYEPEPGGKRAQAQREEAAASEVVIGTRGALRLFGPGALGLAGFVSPDQLLRRPDFRASERMLGFLWSAAERTRGDGQLVIQSQHPTHHAFAAVAARDRERFYAPELGFRAELGYPPFRRLAIVTVRDGRGAPPAEDVRRALSGASGLTVYPPVALRQTRTAARAHRIVVKGGDDLPGLLGPALAALAPGNVGSRGIIDVEVDPVEWPS